MKSIAPGAAPLGADAGAAALAFALQMLGLPADPAEITHQSGKRALDETDLLRAARRFAVKARAHASRFEHLATTPLPALAALKDGGWLVLGRVGEDKVLVLDPRSARPELLVRADFTERWTGRLILLTRRAALGDPARRFGIGWFVGAVKKYRAALGEVLVASFFLQLFGLIAPLFFQVVIDKVLVHRGLSTLEVLALGLGLLSLFDVVLGGLRTYLFAHTTNRIDVELGARLFRHLMALPMAYFQARRVGDTVVRVRELETIRQFLTSSALTLILDLLFATVFLAVLYIYSPSLMLIVAATLPLRGLEPRRHPGVPCAAQREIQALCREPGLSGRGGRRGRDRQVDAARTGVAITLGGAARRLCHGGVSRRRPRRLRDAECDLDQQGADRPDPVLRGKARHQQ